MMVNIEKKEVQHVGPEKVNIEIIIGSQKLMQVQDCYTVQTNLNMSLTNRTFALLGVCGIDFQSSVPRSPDL